MNVLASDTNVYCKILVCFSCIKKDENSLINSTSDSLPFSRDNAFYPLVIENIGLSTASTGKASKVLFTRVKNDQKYSRVMASSKAL